MRMATFTYCCCYPPLPCRLCLWASPPSLCVLWVSIASTPPPRPPSQRLGGWSAVAQCWWRWCWCGSQLCCCPALKSSYGSSARPCLHPPAGWSTLAPSRPPLLCPSTCLIPFTPCCSGITRWDQSRRTHWTDQHIVSVCWLGDMEHVNLDLDLI